MKALWTRLREKLAGMFLREHWMIGYINAPIASALSWKTLPQITWLGERSSNSYLADPFAWPGRPEIICCEEYDYAARLGRIVRLKVKDGRIVEKIPLPFPVKGHLSFPFLFAKNDNVFCLVESSEARKLSIFIWQDEKWAEYVTPLDGIAAADSALFEEGGKLWIAYTDISSDPFNNLNLCYASSLKGPWQLHKNNPVKIGSASSRSAGTPFRADGKLYRPAQDCSVRYGGAVRIMRITQCTPEMYEEEEVTRIAPENGMNPHGFHTLSRWDDKCLVDGKRLVFSPQEILRKIARRITHAVPVFAALAAFVFSTAAAEPVLHKGINLSNWLANAARQPVYARDFMTIKEAGFDNVRIPVNPERYGFKFDPRAPVTTMDFAPLDRAIAMAEGQGLTVVLDIHPPDAFVKTLEDNAWAEDQFVALWASIAEHYRGKPDTLLFELLNEPQYYSAEDKYNALVRKTVAAIRKIDGKRTIVVCAPRGSDMEGLEKLEPFDDTHVIYDFHFYEPFMITHQGIHMGFEKLMLRYFRGVPYPSNLVDHDAHYYAPNAPDPDQARRELDEYVNAKWNAEHIAYRLQHVKEWALAHHARVICGEWGVLRNHIDPASRYRWIADTRKALEADGIGWQLWDWGDLFGITEMLGRTSTDPGDGSVRFIEPERGQRSIEPAAIKAMGLK